MILKDCQDLVNTYIEWLRQKISVENINGICEITTPFLDRHNDQLQIYVKRSNDKFILTDDGYTIRDLESSGFELSTENRLQVFNTILNGFGIQLQGDELIVEARGNNFPQRKHNLIQAILAVNDLFVTAEPMVSRFFKEDVEKYLRTHQIRFTSSVKFAGKSRLDHSFDFVIPASQKQPERILRAIGAPNRQNISLLMFAWNDISEVREPKSTAYGVLNDNGTGIKKEINPEYINALMQYGITPFLWSQREKNVQKLAS
ncbi:MAG: DUF1828 domain-containing protein [Candidatus Stahlbacteria bacterium]|nr:DUF1828 domain-containing protein [Candidatus Stahlbacteria bacterium]